MIISQKEKLYCIFLQPTFYGVLDTIPLIPAWLMIVTAIAGTVMGANAPTAAPAAAPPKRLNVF